MTSCNLRNIIDATVDGDQHYLHTKKLKKIILIKLNFVLR